MTSYINVEFQAKDRDALLKALERITTYGGEWDDLVVGYRADDLAGQRPVLHLFAEQMELKLRRNDHKSTWREKPVEAIKALMNLEKKEFEIALEYFTIGEARTELVDVANYCLILWDRLGMLEQDKLLKEQK